MRGVTHANRNDSEQNEFQLTRLMRGVTWQNSSKSRGYILFQLTRLMRGVTCLCAALSLGTLFQLTRLMRGVTTQKMQKMKLKG